MINCKQVKGKQKSRVCPTMNFRVRTGTGGNHQERGLPVEEYKVSVPSHIVVHRTDSGQRTPGIPTTLNDQHNDMIKPHLQPGIPTIKF